MEVVGVDGSCLVEGGGGEGVVGDAVDLAGQAPCALEQGLDGGNLEQGQFASREAEAVLEIGVDLLSIEAGEMVSDDDALAEGLVTAIDSRRLSSVRPTRMRHMRCSAPMAKLVSRRRSSRTSLRRWWASSTTRTGSCLASLARREISVLIAWCAEERDRSTAIPISHAIDLYMSSTLPVVRET